MTRARDCGSNAPQNRHVIISTMKVTTTIPSWGSEIWNGGVQPAMCPSTSGWRRAWV